MLNVAYQAHAATCWHACSSSDNSAAQGRTGRCAAGGFRPQFFPSLEGIATLFSRVTTAASLWVHLLAINLFAARSAYLEGEQSCCNLLSWIHPLWLLILAFGCRAGEAGAHLSFCPAVHCVWPPGVAQPLSDTESQALCKACKVSSRVILCGSPLHWGPDLVLQAGAGMVGWFSWQCTCIVRGTYFNSLLNALHHKYCPVHRTADAV